MLKSTLGLPETTVMTPQADLLDDALADLRISGSVLLHETYAAPWAVAVPDAPPLRQALGVGQGTRVLMFHFVRRGSFELQAPGVPVTTVHAGEVAICSGGKHRMSRGRGAVAVPLHEVLQRRGPKAAGPADPDATELVCGVFLAHAAPLNPMLDALPPVVKLSTQDHGFSPMLAGVAWMLAHEIDQGALGGFVASRLLELFYAEAVRAYQRGAGALHTGWFKGLADPRIGEAIRRVHGAPGQPWSVPSLAAAVALSPSRFAARFRLATGQSVMGYVARWRLNWACRLLRETAWPMAEIATRVGYDSLPAFSRAFKAQLGLPPAAWRAALERPPRLGPPLRG
jgi:AraC-like DNA-binding protein